MKFGTEQFDSKPAMPIGSLPEVSVCGEPSTKTDVDNNEGCHDQHVLKRNKEIGHPHQDYFLLSNCVKIGFDDIFIEPEAIRSGDIGKHLSPRLRLVFGNVYSYTQEAIYFFLSMITGLFFGLLWGTVFGAWAFVDVWLVQPTVAMLLAVMHSVTIPVGAMVRGFIDPLFQSVGQIWSSVSVNVRLNMLHSLRTGSAGNLRRSLVATVDRDAGRSQEWFGFV